MDTSTSELIKEFESNGFKVQSYLVEDSTHIFKFLNEIYKKMFLVTPLPYDNIDSLIELKNELDVVLSTENIDSRCFYYFHFDIDINQNQQYSIDIINSILDRKHKNVVITIFAGKEYYNYVSPFEGNRQVIAIRKDDFQLEDPDVRQQNQDIFQQKINRWFSEFFKEIKRLRINQQHFANTIVDAFEHQYHDNFAISLIGHKKDYIIRTTLDETLSKIDYLEFNKYKIKIENLKLFIYYENQTLLEDGFQLVYLPDDISFMRENIKILQDDTSFDYNIHSKNRIDDFFAPSWFAEQLIAVFYIRNLATRYNYNDDKCDDYIELLFNHHHYEDKKELFVSLLFERVAFELKDLGEVKDKLGRIFVLLGIYIENIYYGIFKGFDDSSNSIANVSLRGVNQLNQPIPFKYEAQYLLDRYIPIDRDETATFKLLISCKNTPIKENSTQIIPISYDYYLNRTL